jgi:hypothetical protein
MWDLWWAKWHWDRFSPGTSVSPANSHSTDCSPHSSSTTRGWYNRPNSGRRTKWDQSYPTSRRKKNNNNNNETKPGTGASTNLHRILTFDTCIKFITWLFTELCLFVSLYTSSVACDTVYRFYITDKVNGTEKSLQILLCYSDILLETLSRISRNLHQGNCIPLECDLRCVAALSIPQPRTTVL